MKNRFVNITLILTMLLVFAVPTQAFAAEKNCNLKQSNVLNTQISKVYSQMPQTSVNKLTEALKQCQNGKITTAQLKTIVQQLRQKAPAADTTTAKAAEKATVKNNTPTAATPAKEKAVTPAKTAATPVTPAATGAYEQQVVDLVNKERAAAGLPALKLNTKLSGVAEKKAEDMRDRNYFSHTSPTYGSPFDMMKQFGVSYKAAGENIAKGQKTPAAVMNGWMNSSGHRANILSANYTEIGVGYVTDSKGNTYWVQMFIRP